MNNQTYYVRDYRKSGISDDEAIRRCFADCASADSRTVVFDGDDYLISEAILLPSDTTVVIDGCTVRQADEVFDNVFRGDNLVIDPDDPYGFPLECRPIRNIRILGKNGAAVRGPEKNRVGFHTVLNETQPMTGDFWGWRTLTVSLSMCDGFEIAGIRFENGRCWTLSFDICRNGYLHDLYIQSDVKNGDGIDFRSGCHNCRVENLTAMTSDDAVACTALSEGRKDYPSGKYLYTLEPTRYLSERTAEQKDISGITVRGLRVGGKHHGVICLCAGGCRVSDVLIEDVEEIPSAWESPYREATVKIYTGYGSGYTAGDLHDITVKNVRGLYAAHTLYSNAEVRNVTLSGITHADANTEPIKLDRPDGFRIV